MSAIWPSTFSRQVSLQSLGKNVNEIHWSLTCKDWDIVLVGLVQCVIDNAIFIGESSEDIHTDLRHTESKLIFRQIYVEKKSQKYYIFSYYMKNAIDFWNFLFVLILWCQHQNTLHRFSSSDLWHEVCPATSSIIDGVQLLQESGCVWQGEVLLQQTVHQVTVWDVQQFMVPL